MGSVLNLKNKRRFIKSALVALSLLFSFSMPMNASTSSLNLITANVIKGQSPYFSKVSGNYLTGPIEKTEDLLKIAFLNANGNQYDEYGFSSDGNIIKPINLSSNVITFTDIKTLIPTAISKNYNSANKGYEIELNEIFQSANFTSYGGFGTVKAKGKFYLTITDGQRNQYKLEDSVISNSDYMIILSVSNDAEIFTDYGYPRQTKLAEKSKTFFVKASNGISAPKVVSVKVNANENSQSKYGWTQNKGFDVSSPLDKENNFPKTAFNDAYFDLVFDKTINGASSQKDGTSTITATAEKLNDQNNVIRVKLSGPSGDNNTTQFSPTTIKVFSDNDQQQLAYTFTIKKWFVPLSSTKTGTDSTTICSAESGFRLPLARELTNSNASHIGLKGSLPDWSENKFARAIGDGSDAYTYKGGLLSEWGSLTAFTASGFASGQYWVSDNEDSANAQYNVNFATGLISLVQKTQQNYVMCVSDGNPVITPKPTQKNPRATFAVPSLDPKDSSFNGPSNQWDSVEGFKVQDNNNASSNFPTVAANGYKFKLNLIDVENVNLLSIASTNFGTIINAKLVNKTNNSVDVVFSGPDASANKSNAQSATLPARFNVTYDKKIIYSFEIVKWFILKQNEVNFADAKSTCLSIGYGIPDISELSNATNSSNNFKRTISGGLFAEWGKVSEQVAYYWTKTNAENQKNYTVNNNTGYRQGKNVNETYKVACVFNGTEVRDDTPIVVPPPQPEALPKEVYIQPSLALDTGNSDVWVQNKGFKVITADGVTGNFPTTGFNNASFEIVINNNDTQVAQTPYVLSDGSANVGATATKIKDENNNVTVKVTLTGPDLGSSNDFKPTTFKIYSGATNSTNVIYQFKLDKWFVSSKAQGDYSANKASCESMNNYRLAEISELTNDPYKRVVNGALFAEWGDMSQYAASSFNANGAYWSKNTGINQEQITVDGKGAKSSSAKTANGNMLCVSDGNVVQKESPIVPQQGKPKVLAVQPSIGNNTSNDSSWNSNSPNIGFKVIDIDTSKANFPTTGFNNAKFKLLTENVNINTARLAKGAGAGSILGSLTHDVNKPNELLITLTGQHEDNLSTEFKETTFNVYADEAQSQKIYSFTVSKWFVAGKQSLSYARADAYCAGIPNYRLADLGELTNASNSDSNWSGTQEGWTTNSYSRAIGVGVKGNTAIKGKGGLFAEWGNGTQYSNSDIKIAARYWSNNTSNANSKYSVITDNGAIDELVNDKTAGVLCVNDGAAIVHEAVQTQTAFALPNVQNNQTFNNEIWSPSGFKVSDKADVENNFPSTAFNNAYFDIVTTGGEIKYPAKKRIEGGSSELDIEVTPAPENDLHKVRVTIKGPSEITANKFIPTEFVVYSDINQTNEIYRFKIKKWFIFATATQNYTQAETFCKTPASNYRLPYVGEVTNAKASGFEWKGTADSTWGKNAYARETGAGLASSVAVRSKGGLLPEWGNLAGYGLSSSTNSVYWSQNVYVSGGNQLIVDGSTGEIKDTGKVSPLNTVCVSDGNDVSNNSNQQPEVVNPDDMWVLPNRSNHGGAANSDNLNGPSEQFNFLKGFKLQNLSKPAENFPTTGAKGLKFTIDLGVDASDAEVTKSPLASNLRVIKSANGTKLTITLDGPDYNSNKETALTKIPTEFKIYADAAQTKLVYAFTINKWFIVKPQTAKYKDALSYCVNLGYRMPAMTDFTNANLTANNIWSEGLTGQGNNYQRRIGGGLFAEWGSTNTGFYQDSHLKTLSDFIWSKEIKGDQRLVVNADTGSIKTINADSDEAAVACIHDFNPARAIYSAPNLFPNDSNQPEWDPLKGFIVRNITDVNSNFPKTGFDVAYFDLTIENETTDNISFSKSGSDNVGIELIPVPNYTDKNKIRVKLTGPNSTNKQAFTPTTFTIFADRNKAIPIYSFKVNKWFIFNTDSQIAQDLSVSNGYCESLPNYRVAKINELTNAGSGFFTSLLNNATNKVNRAIGSGTNATSGVGGLFAEWGNLKAYLGEGFASKFYWTISRNKDLTSNTKYGISYEVDGSIGGQDAIAVSSNQFPFVTACVSDGNAVPRMTASSVNVNLPSENSNQAEWTKEVGFKVVNASKADSNFPNTGFDGAYFEVNLQTETAESVVYERVSGSKNVDIALVNEPDSKTNVIKITLKGPNATNKQAFEPTEFAIYSNKGKKNKVYSFKVSKWFISDSTGTNLSDTKTYCYSLPNYRIAEMRELTNATAFGSSVLTNWTNTFARAIGKGGLLPEWGDVTALDNSQFKNLWYWSNEYLDAATDKFINVNLSTGAMTSSKKDDKTQGIVCVSDGATVPRPSVPYVFVPSDDRYAKKADEWLTNGFKTIDATKAESNFPRTAFHNAHFRLFIKDGFSESVNIERDSGSENVTASIAIIDRNHADVWLYGPREDWKQPFKPTQFTVYSDKKKTLKLYTFKISKWFIGSNATFDRFNAANYCLNMQDYRIPKTYELTNAANLGLKPVANWHDNTYTRAIGDGSAATAWRGGLFAEWGNTEDHAGFPVAWYWAEEYQSRGDDLYVKVGSHKGDLYNENLSSNQVRAMCVSDGTEVGKPRLTIIKAGGRDDKQHHVRTQNYGEYNQNFPWNGFHGAYFTIHYEDSPVWLVWPTVEANGVKLVPSDQQAGRVTYTMWGELTSKQTTFELIPTAGNMEVFMLRYGFKPSAWFKHIHDNFNVWDLRAESCESVNGRVPSPDVLKQLPEHWGRPDHYEQFKNAKFDMFTDDFKNKCYDTNFSKPYCVETHATLVNLDAFVWTQKSLPYSVQRFYHNYYYEENEFDQPERGSPWHYDKAVDHPSEWRQSLVCQMKL